MVQTARTTEVSRAVVVAVLPEYRKHFLSALTDRFGDRLVFAAGDKHLVDTVQSGENNVVSVSRLTNVGLFGRRLLWQCGALRFSWSSDVVVTDLNPRSLTAWAILLSRRVRRRRTLVWGHILPRAGENARTVPLRRSMRRLADGVISYTWSDSAIVVREDPHVPVWVAANGLYPSDWLCAVAARSTPLSDFVYVGRLVSEKKPELLIRAFALYTSRFPERAHRLVLVGAGSERRELEALANELRVADVVVFAGGIHDFAKLSEIYEKAIASVSPGYVGLSLTQSLGFGVPMIVAETEPHAPEFELLNPASGVLFRSNDADSLCDALNQVYLDRTTWESRRESMVQHVKNRYSADAMAAGFAAALEDDRDKCTREVG